MSNIPDYRCTSCHKEVGREELTVKKCVFLEMGAGARTKRSRVLAWLCKPCLHLDPIWNEPAFSPEKVDLTNAK